MSNVTLAPYLFFAGNCREVMEYYQTIFGGELTVQDFSGTEGEMAEKMQGKVMHADLHGGEIDLMASDSTRDEFGVSCISLSLTGTDEEKLRGLFDKLCEGGKDIMPLKKESWGDIFGSVTDKFGIDWMVNIG